MAIHGYLKLWNVKPQISRTTVFEIVRVFIGSLSFSQFFFAANLKGIYFYPYSIDKNTELVERIHLYHTCRKYRARKWTFVVCIFLKSLLLFIPPICHLHGVGCTQEWGIPGGGDGERYLPQFPLLPVRLGNNSSSPGFLIPQSQQL